MMLMFFIIVMCSYFYSVCLVSLVLKKPYSKEHLSVVAFKYSTCDIGNEFELCSMLKHGSNGKCMIYGPNGI